ncbi:MAG: hypothetical protein R3277_02390 [Brumimicrobium sp.]|nr:hypothetical protein [Brumimicrobium sp.]
MKKNSAPNRAYTPLPNLVSNDKSFSLNQSNFRISIIFKTGSDSVASERYVQFVNMRTIFIIILLFPFISRAQTCPYNEIIVDDPFLSTVFGEGRGYWTQFSEIESDSSHYSWQERIIDSLKTKFNHEELFEMVNCKTDPFIRVAAFQAFVETEYNQKTIVEFFEDDFIKKRGDFSLAVPDSIGVMLYTVNCFNTPVYIKEVMFRMVDLTLKEYVNCKKLDLESTLYLKSIFPYRNYFTQTYQWGDTLNRSFSINGTEASFGTIDLNLYDGLNKNLTLKSKLRISNLTRDTITVYSKASSHTACDQYSYTILPKGETIINFRSLINTKQKSGYIDRKITFLNPKTGQVLMYGINAEIIESKKHITKPKTN